jgi:hypothetical protein
MNAAEREALHAAMQLPYPSFFCNAEKRPTCPHGYKDAALPAHGLATLAARYPGELVGVPTGQASGFSVLDVDKGKGGGEWWAANKGRLPATRMHRTRSGGIHCLFKHRDGLLNSVSKIAPGVDVRASGGYVIWWPAHGFAVVDHELAAWPSWLTPPEPEPAPPPPRRDPPSPRQAVAAVEGIVRVVATAVNGQRNAVTYWGARRLRELSEQGRLSESLAREIIIDAASRNGLPAREIALTVKSAFEARAHG